MHVLFVDVSTNFTKPISPHFDTVCPPLGAMCLAAYIRKYIKIKPKPEMRIVNARVDFNSYDEMIELVQEFNPEIVCLRSLTITYEQLFKAAERVKAWNPNCVVIAGGPYPTSEPEFCAMSNYIDYVVCGEGEKTLSELITTFESGGSLSQIKGLAYVSKDEYIPPKCRAPIKNIDNLPIPAYDLIDIDKYSNLTSHSLLRRKYAEILTSRGCPYHCTYCHNIFNRVFRARSPKKVLDEIEFLVKEYGIKDFSIEDDCFNFDQLRAIEILKLIIKKKLNIRLIFANGLRADMMTEYIVDLMEDAGTILVCYGVETASPRLQKLIGKHLDLDKTKNIINYTCKKEIITNVLFMIGFPGETRREAMMTFNYCRGLKRIHFPYLNIVKLYPGTPIYDEAIHKYGLSEYTLRKNRYSTYFDSAPGSTATSTGLVREIQRRWLMEILLNKERLKAVLPIQLKHLSKGELEQMYRNFFPKISSLKQLDVISR